MTKDFMGGSIVFLKFREIQRSDHCCDFLRFYMHFSVLVSKVEILLGKGVYFDFNFLDEEDLDWREPFLY